MLILLFALIFFVSFLIVVKDIYPESYRSDAIRHLRAINNFRSWVVPGKMSSFTDGKSFLKEVSIYLILLLGKLTRIKSSFYLIVFTMTILHFVSVVLLFYIFENVFNLQIAYIITLFYLFSPWPYLIILQGGYQITAQAMFLGVVFFFVKSMGSESFYFYPYLVFLSGVCTTLMLFSSASARKLIPTTLIIFIYSQNYLFNFSQFEIRNWMVTFITAFCLVFLFVFRISYKKLIRYLYERRGTLGPIKLSIKDKYGFDYYLQKLGNICIFFIHQGTMITAVFALQIFSKDPLSFLFNCLTYFTGYFLTFLLFIFPNIKKLIFELSNYYNPNAIGHFRLYADVFKKRNIEIKNSTRAKDSGTKWFVKLLLRVAPADLALFLTAFFCYILFIENIVGFLVLVVVIFTFLLPFIWGEITHSPQISRSYYPCYVPILALLGFLLYSAIGESSFLQRNSYFLLSPFLLLAFYSGMKALFSDILPTRIGATTFEKFLDEKKITQIYVYDCEFYEPFLPLFRSRPDLNVVALKTVSEHTEGFLLIPPLNSKSVAYESIGSIIDSGDFILEECLQKAKITGVFEQAIERRIKTVGASNFWVLESEVTGFRDLILNEITKEDRENGHALLIDLKKLNA